MASTRKRETKDGKLFYEIRYRVSRESPELSMRWYPPAGWSQKVVDRELHKVAAEFERQCRAGEVISLREQKKQKAEEKALREAEEAKHITLKRFGADIFMPGKLAGTIGRKAIAESTRAFYDNALRVHIYPVFGDRKLIDITRADLEAFLLSKFNSKLAESSMTAIYITLKQLFDAALDTEAITSNPMLRVKKPRHDKTEKKSTVLPTYSVEEVQHILECLEHEPLKWRALVTLLIDTGCRRGEACGLRWKSVDFKTGCITIDSNLLYTPQKGVYNGTPKTAASVRTIDVSSEVLALLKQLRLEQVDTCVSPYVFSQDGKPEPMHPDSPTRYFKRFGKKYGIPDFHPHKLRHTFASIAITNRADIASVSEKLGHANKGITLKMYTHADPTSIKAAGDIFRNALKTKSDTAKQA